MLLLFPVECNAWCGTVIQQLDCIMDVCSSNQAINLYMFTWNVIAITYEKQTREMV